MRKQLCISAFAWLRPSALGLAALGLLAGCKPVGPNYTRPTYTAPPVYKEVGAPSVIVPPPNPDGGTWKPATPSDGMLKGKWWEIYNDPQLNKYEERIAGYNQAVRQAMENYLAARDEVLNARSQLYPRLGAGPSFTHEVTSRNGPNVGRTDKTSYNDLLLAGAGSWEPDFWGKVRRNIEATHATEQADAADMAGVSLMLESEMAADYFSLRGADAQIQVLQSTVTELERQLKLTEKRRDGGVATDVDVAQARTQLDTVKAQLIDLSVARAQFEHAVGTIADYKLPNFSIPFSPLSGSLPNVPLGVPSQLLERRPDIASAERQTQAANAQIGIAIAAFYPDITLNGTGGFESTHGGTWIQGPSALWALGGAVTELLIDGGQRRALTDEARHKYEAQVSGYKGVVFLAFEDVENNLSTLRILNEEQATERLAVASAQHSLDLSNQRYKGGVTSYLEVITAETTLLNNQRVLTDLETRQFAASVQLVRSLGGGWDASQLPK